MSSKPCRPGGSQCAAASFAPGRGVGHGWRSSAIPLGPVLPASFNRRHSVGSPHQLAGTEWPKRSHAPPYVPAGNSALLSRESRFVYQSVTVAPVRGAPGAPLACRLAGPGIESGRKEIPTSGAASETMAPRSTSASAHIAARQFGLRRTWHPNSSRSPSVLSATPAFRRRPAQTMSNTITPGSGCQTSWSGSRRCRVCCAASDCPCATRCEGR